MILIHFNLKDMPFKKDCPTDTLFTSSVFQEGVTRLDHIREHRGVFLLTGDPGSGKTTLLRHFHSHLNQNAYHTFYIPLATVTVMDFYRQLNHALGGTGTYRKADLFRNIQEGIKTLVQNRKIVPVFIFDEVHLMKNENFTELQILLNFEFDSVMPAIVILAGQSHLRDRLSREIFRSFDQRIALKYHLIPLGKKECTEYIHNGIKRVGGMDSIFSANALEAIFNNTQGNLREIASLATKALLATAIAKKNTVSEEEVFQASKEV
jgi:type II secretory pathway predicted ATPase ExeA